MASTLRISSSSRWRRRWQPRAVTPLVQRIAWLMLIAQSGIVVSGGIVRLTGSGLGCPTWPRCTDESWATTPAMGIHGFIEYGNRMLGVLLGLIGLLSIFVVWRLRKHRPDLFIFAFSLTAIVPIQAVIGGISVHMELNPWIVAAHFIPSAIAVAVSAIFVRRTYDTGIRDASLSRPASLKIIGLCITVLTIVVVVLGVLTTGAGPHAGDAQSARNGLDPLLISRLHALPVWLLVGVTIGGLFLAQRYRLQMVIRTFGVLFLVELAQGAIGYVQYFLGLPEAIVALHLLGACAVIAAAAAAVDSLYPRKKS